MNTPLTINDYAAPIEAEYGTGPHTGITGALIVAFSDTTGDRLTVPMMDATAKAYLPYPVSGDALAVARDQVLANRRAKRVELSDRYPTLNL